MRSLRARLLAIVLALAGAGLLALAAVTYTEQRSFLEDRLDREARAAAPAVSHELDELGYRVADAGPSALVRGSPAGAPDGPRAAPGGAGASSGGGPGHGGGGGPNLNLPPGTYGQRREASGRVLGGRVFYAYGQATQAAPRLPAHVTLGELFTVGSVGSSGLQYRVLAARDREDSGITIVAIPTREVQQTLHHLLVVEALVIGAVLALLALGASWAVRLGLRPLDRIARTASEIAAGELSRRVSPADARTEAGRLGLALNAMLERLEQAFAQRASSEERLRRFIADASHELRTPLASIRGYAELFRMGATADARDTERAMRRIEEESQRMGTLVEDLLTLARLDETREPSRAPVDLAVLAADAVADARASAPERPITLTAPDAPSLVSGDADQLRQVLANLLRNALVHTPASSPIEVSLERAREDALLSVRDHGPGLPAGACEELFERFWRAEHGRERGKAGAGLGLAITRAILDAHGGTITAQNAPGGGALFTVRLPVAPAPAPAEVELI